MYPFLQETLTRLDIVVTDCRLILLSRYALLTSRNMLALLRPDAWAAAT
jgi:hypothetical protein